MLELSTNYSLLGELLCRSALVRIHKEEPAREVQARGDSSQKMCLQLRNSIGCSVCITKPIHLNFDLD